MSERLGFSEYEIGVLKKYGFTPETARDYAVAKLRKFNLGEEHLKWFEDVNKLQYTESNLILELVYRKGTQPDEWVKATGKDFSDPYYYSLFLYHIDY